MTAPPSAAPSAARRHVALAMGTFGTMLDVALIVAGSALLGLAITVLLDGFELVNLAMDLSTGAMLGSGLVIGIVGGFALGVASEGPLGRGRRSLASPETHILLARIVSVVLVGAILVFGAGYLEEFATDLPEPFGIGVEIIRVVGIGGLTAVPLIAVPLAWLVRTGRLGTAMAADGDIPIMYLMWAIATMVQL
jgi:hypothetical protein